VQNMLRVVGGGGGSTSFWALARAPLQQNDDDPEMYDGKRE